MLDLATQPLFQLLGAIIVLLLADMRPVYGGAAAIIWAAWIYMGSRGRGKNRQVW